MELTLGVRRLWASKLESLAVMWDPPLSAEGLESEVGAWSLGFSHQDLAGGCCRCCSWVGYPHLTSLFLWQTHWVLQFGGHTKCQKTFTRREQVLACNAQAVFQSASSQHSTLVLGRGMKGQSILQSSCQGSHYGRCGTADRNLGSPPKYLLPGSCCDSEALGFLYICTLPLMIKQNAGAYMYYTPIVPAVFVY